METISFPKAIENAHDHNIVTIIVDFLSLKTISLPRAIENAHGQTTAADDATLWRVYYINFPEPSVACCGSV